MGDLIVPGNWKARRERFLGRSTEAFEPGIEGSDKQRSQPHKSTLGCFFVCFFFDMTRRANVSMLGALARRLGKPLRVGTSTALLVGLVAAVASREMSSVVTVRVAPTARVSDLAGARLTKLPVPSVGAATAVQAATLWQDRPAVVLVLRRPG